MKRILLTIYVIFLILFFPHNALCVNEMGWTDEQAAIWAALKVANHPVYTNYKSHCDNSTCPYDNYGLNYALMYKVEGDASYCTKAYNSNSGCVPATANRDKTRDCFVERALAYSFCGDAVDAGTKAAWESQLDGLVALVQNSTHGTRVCDTDELMGHYFGCLIYDLAKDGAINQCTSNAISGGDAFGIDVTPGGCGCYGSNTLRDCVCKYFTNYGDGDFIEGTEYNKNTLWYTLLGVHALNDYYGTDKFPEITEHYSDFASNYYQRSTPDYSQHYQWGDIQSPFLRTHYRHRSQALYSAIAYLDDDDSNMWDLYDGIDGDSCVRETFGLFVNPSAERTKASGQTSSNIVGTGQAFWHNDWGVNDTFFASQNRKEYFADHSWHILENFEIWRNDGWITTARKHYYGDDYFEHPYSNGLLIFGGFAGMMEAKGQVNFEAGSDYMYHSGVTSGFQQNAGSQYNYPPFVRESSNQKLFRHNGDGTDTVFLFNRIDACRPDSTDCMSTTYKNNLDSNQKQNYDRAVAEDFKHIYVLNTYASPSKSGDTFSWTASTGDTVEFHTFMDSYTNETVNMETVSYYNAPYYFSGTIVNAEKSWYELRLKIATAGAYTFYPILNVMHIGDNATYTEIDDSTGTETVKGAMVETSDERIVALFNVTEDDTTTFTSYLDGSGAAKYDSDRFTKASKMSIFKTDAQAQFTTDDTKDIEVFILGLDPDLSWTITKNGGAAGCSVSSEGVCTFTISGAAQTHTVVWTSEPFDCDGEDWRGCVTQKTCEAQGWSWWDESCHEFGEPEELCTDNWINCYTQEECENAEWCWQSGYCLEECEEEPPQTQDITIYAGGDTYIDSDNDTTNYNESSLLVISDVTSGGGLSIGDTCNGACDDCDSRTIECTVNSCSDQIMIASVAREESGDTEPNSVTWNGDAMTKIIGEDYWYSIGEVTQYYLLNPDAGTHNLVATFDAASSVDIVLGMVTICNATQQAPEDSCDSDNTTTDECTLTTATDGALLISSGGSVQNTTWSIDATDDLDTKVYEKSPPAAGLDLVMGYGDTASAGNYTCGWTEGLDGDRNAVVCSAWKGTGGAASSSYKASLLSFDLSDIPSGADINSVTLKMKANASSAGRQGDVWAYTCLRDFNEANATWNKYDGSNNWTTAGGKSNAADMTGVWSDGTNALASYSVGGAEIDGDTITFTSTGSLATLVQNNIGGEINIILHGEEISGGADISFYDRENGTQANVPYLDINYYGDPQDEGYPDPDKPAVYNNRAIKCGRIIGIIRN